MTIAQLKRLLLWLSILCCLFLIGWGGYYYWQGTPRYSLYQMGKAIQNHDSKTFLLYVDIDEIVNGLADSTSAAVEKGTSSDAPSGNPEGNRKSSRNKKDLFSALMPQVIKALKPILKRELIKVVEDIGKDQTISPLALCTLAKVRRNGLLAEVSVKIEQDQSYAFTMARASRRIWKVIRIDMDLLDLMQKPRGAER